MCSLKIREHCNLKKVMDSLDLLSFNIRLFGCYLLRFTSLLGFFSLFALSFLFSYASSLIVLVKLIFDELANVWHFVLNCLKIIDWLWVVSQELDRLLEFYLAALISSCLKLSLDLLQLGYDIFVNWTLLVLLLALA